MEPKSIKTQLLDSRFLLAILFTAISFYGIYTISNLLLKNSNSENEKVFQAAQMIFNAILPMIATWVGAIIAYYFSTKQVESIQEQQRQVIDSVNRQTDVNISAMNVMKETMISQIEATNKLIK